ncbi:glycosyltransferase family 4 protein [Deinococcus gobiensis]|uniref:Glycosyl transferase, group 1 family protein n=1 Tax=Deinococcus gobiensis (strain DSM 21396 / JCM 16679 / CGMCC 1.7299 / I-0) TaxID=745776 RepID=H8H083_DEIGI|nr:glycosyltransferase family 4 protein [Deinococcus gobiensis]AFD27135.1 Glycosyl transferase, group 1 family protein [Deinococcus gobiensis I-0]
MSKRILFVDQSGQLGGAELSLIDVAKYYSEGSKVVLFEDGPFRNRLESLGISVKIISLSQDIREIRRDSNKIPNIKSFLSIIKLVAQTTFEARKYDLIVPNTQKALMVCAIVGFLTRKPVLWFLRDIMSSEHFSQNMRRIVKIVSNNLVKLVIANSQASAQALLDQGGNLNKVRVIHDGLDTKQIISQAGNGIPDLRSLLGISDEPLVGVFSRLSPWKGQHILLESLRDLPGVHAIFVGDAIFGEKDYVEHLKNLVKDWDLEERVHFLGFREDVPALMRSVDIVLHTSTVAEPLGRVIIEGMLSRRPVIATAAGGALEIVQNGYNGLLVPPDDSKELTESILRLLNDRELANEIAIAGFKHAKEKFDIENMIQNLDLEIESILDK